MCAKIKYIIPFYLCICLSAQCQDYKQKFTDSFSKNDTASVQNILKKWEQKDPNNPELFIAYFNYYAKKSLGEFISMDHDQKSEQALVIKDSTGKEVGYLNSTMRYNPDIIEKGFEKISKGIVLYPNRLDMRFGKIYLLGDNEDFPAFTKEIIETIEYGNRIKNKWLWKDGKSLEDTKNFFLNSIQSYVQTIYNKEDNSLLPYMRQIAETVLKYYPDHVESLSDVAITYLVTGDYSNALLYLITAEKFAPKDCIVLGNIAEAYKRTKDKTNAIVYYEKMVKYGHNDQVQYAQEQLQLLK